ncbi:MAG: hypothetical protein HWE23_15765 [Rhodobacteraceae bacterium]|nr:hypothetical protein [Paracoccaceae bacterium]
MTSEQEMQTLGAGLSLERMDAAVAKGILSRSQADDLIAFWQAPAAIDGSDADEEALSFSKVSHVDAEEVRFVRGFHDVFIAIGIVVFLFGLFYGLKDALSGGQIAGVLTMAIWGLSEVFSRKLRLALPSFLLSLFFTPAAMVAVIGLIGGSGAALTGQAGDVMGSLSNFAGIGDESSIKLLLPVLLGIAAAYLHYYRFRVPVGVSGIVGGIVLLFAVIVYSIAPTFLQNNLSIFTLLAGVGCFAIAMYFDKRDLRRITVNTDKAFWLHLQAAPLIVHSLLNIAIKAGIKEQEISYSVVAIAIFLALSLVAILIDRRALLVSGLSYFGIAIGYLISQTALASDVSLAITLVILGAFILLLGTGWRPVRRAVMSPFAATPLMRFVPAAS